MRRKTPPGRVREDGKPRLMKEGNAKEAEIEVKNWLEKIKMNKKVP